MKLDLSHSSNNDFYLKFALNVNMNIRNQHILDFGVFTIENIILNYSERENDTRIMYDEFLFTDINGFITPINDLGI